MGVFQSEKIFTCNPGLISVIANNIVNDFQADGYECGVVPTAYNGIQVSIRKGGMFKAALGLKTALNVTISPVSASSINIKAGVGLFEQQAIPTAIMLFVFWPVIVTQIWGLVQQSNLDDRVMDIAARTIKFAGDAASSSGTPNPRDNWDAGVPL